MQIRGWAARAHIPSKAMVSRPSVRAHPQIWLAAQWIREVGGPGVWGGVTRLEVKPDPSWCQCAGYRVWARAGLAGH